MRKFKYKHQSIGMDGNLKTEDVVISEKEVLDRFYQAWLDMNLVTHRPDRVSKSECVEDWIAMNNAEEVEEDQ